MSTLRVSAINNASASSGGLAISAAGNVTGAGMDLITSQTFSAASAVNVNNCFSSTYENYQVLINAKPSADGNFLMRFRVSGSDNSTGNYKYAIVGITTAAGGYNLNSTGTTEFRLANSQASLEPMCLSLQLFSPQLSAQTVGTVTVGHDEGGGAGYFTFTQTTQFDGMSFYAATGNFTGTIRIYGYRNA